MAEYILSVDLGTTSCKTILFDAEFNVWQPCGRTMRPHIHAQGNYSLCKSYSFIGSRGQRAFGEFLRFPARNPDIADGKLEMAKTMRASIVCNPIKEPLETVCSRELKDGAHVVFESSGAGPAKISALAAVALGRCKSERQ